MRFIGVCYLLICYRVCAISGGVGSSAASSTATAPVIEPVPSAAAAAAAAVASTQSAQDEAELWLPNPGLNIRHLPGWLFGIDGSTKVDCSGRLGECHCVLDPLRLRDGNQSPHRMVVDLVAGNGNEVKEDKEAKLRAAETAAMQAWSTLSDNKNLITTELFEAALLTNNQSVIDFVLDCADRELQRGLSLSLSLCVCVCVCLYVYVCLC